MMLPTAILVCILSQKSKTKTGHTLLIFLSVELPNFLRRHPTIHQPWGCEFKNQPLSCCFLLVCLASWIIEDGKS